MRKRITPTAAFTRPSSHGEWLDIERLAEIDISSDDPLHPIEGALVPGTGSEWRATQPGTQTIRIVFDKPQDLKTIHLVFAEDRCFRTQEFVLRWAGEKQEPPVEILRQQYNFSPNSVEIEDYAVELNGVKMLELEIIPAIGGNAYASLKEMRLR